MAGPFSGHNIPALLIIGLGPVTTTPAAASEAQGQRGSEQHPLLRLWRLLPGNFYAMGSIGYTLNLYGLNRNLAFGGLNRVADSSVTGNQLNVSGETGYDLAFRALF